MDSTLIHWTARADTPLEDGRCCHATDEGATLRAPLQVKVYHSETDSASPRSLPIYARWPCPMDGSVNCSYA